MTKRLRFTIYLGIGAVTIAALSFTLLALTIFSDWILNLWAQWGIKLPLVAVASGVGLILIGHIVSNWILAEFGLLTTQKNTEQDKSRVLKLVRRK